ncbi:hypothetical protein MSG28_005296 [Choristoneura fumiferana]|uniref:Uncharacterized protein n=1 Tax=Choristoneura fumiferana TaxID=7141 RepID=A0ACC0JRD3_CHOFU|nr:hypothetical protein MSG28_005296 [Choristoneura fumiferana]
MFFFVTGYNAIVLMDRRGARGEKSLIQIGGRMSRNSISGRRRAAAAASKHKVKPGNALVTLLVLQVSMGDEPCNAKERLISGAQPEMCPRAAPEVRENFR